MKDTRPIEMQVKGLTEDEKKTICRVGVRYDIVMTVAVVCFLIVAVVFIVNLSMINHQIEHFSYTQTVNVDNKQQEIYDPTANQRFAELVAQQKWTMDVFVAVVIAGVILVLGTMVTGLIVIANKYPFYSDKRFTYLRRQRKQK